MLFAIATGSDTGVPILGCCGMFFLATLLAFIFYHITLMKALQACSFRNQRMPPGLVWLDVVPLLGLVWQFIVVVQVGDSLKKEYEDRGLRGSDDSFGKGLGISYIVFNLIGAGVNLFCQFALTAPRVQEGTAVVGCMVMVMGLISFILWIVYWVKIAGFTRELNEHGRPDDRYHGDYDRDDRDDDRDYDHRQRYDNERHDDQGDSGGEDNRQSDGGLPRYPGS